MSWLKNSKDIPTQRVGNKLYWLEGLLIKEGTILKRHRNARDSGFHYEVEGSHDPFFLRTYFTCCDDARKKSHKIAKSVAKVKPLSCDDETERIRIWCQNHSRVDNYTDFVHTYYEKLKEQDDNS